MADMFSQDDEQDIARKKSPRDLEGSASGATRLPTTRPTAAQQVAAHFSLSERELIDAWDWDASNGVISNALRKSILETGSDDSCHHLMELFPEGRLPSSDSAAQLLVVIWRKNTAIRY
ncbi:hypothetical protein O4H48_21985 [Rhodobacteraceae bacterium G21628-S1]|nr:hypothetical protein [Rhodobacteraceae bacterium G21628-S1]